MTINLCQYFKMNGNVEFTKLMTATTEWKSCRTKQYESFVCIPPINTVILNKYKDTLIYKQLVSTYGAYLQQHKLMGYLKRCFIPADKFEGLDNNIKQFLIQNNCVTGQGRRFVVSGACGELSIVSDVQNLVTTQGKPVLQALSEKKKAYGQDTVADWVRVTIKAETQGG